MGQLNFKIDDKLEDKFRKVLSIKFGYKKGNMQIAFEEALDDWVKKNS